MQNELAKIGNLDLGELDCSKPGNMTIAANTLEELASIIDDIGLKKLQAELGIDISFVFAP